MTAWSHDPNSLSYFSPVCIADLIGPRFKFTSTSFEPPLPDHPVWADHNSFPEQVRRSPSVCPCDPDPKLQPTKTVLSVRGQIGEDGLMDGRPKKMWNVYNMVGGWRYLLLQGDPVGKPGQKSNRRTSTFVPVMIDRGNTIMHICFF